MNGVDYASGAVPPDYRCASCGAHGVKLWRLGYTMDPDLFCVACTETRAAQRLETGGMASDQIGAYLPAVPDEEGAGFWGYTSVPPAGVAWWKALPMALPAAQATSHESRRALAAAALAPVRGHCSEGYDRALSEVEDALDIVHQDGVRAATDADVALEFWRRFRPVRVLLGRNGDRVTYADGHDDETDWLSGVSIDHGVVAQQSDNAQHAAGEDGFVTALERARELVRSGR